MADDRVFVVAWLKPRPGREGELEDLLRGMCPPSRAEAGCVFYNLFRPAEGAGPFHFVECWRDRAALDAHCQTPHFKAFEERAGALVAAPPEIRLLQAVDAAF